MKTLKIIIGYESPVVSYGELNISDLIVSIMTKNDILIYPNNIEKLTDVDSIRKLREDTKNRLKEALKNGKESIIYNNECIDYKHRKEIIDIAKENGYTIYAWICIKMHNYPYHYSSSIIGTNYDTPHISEGFNKMIFFDMTGYQYKCSSKIEFELNNKWITNDENNIIGEANFVVADKFLIDLYFIYFKDRFTCLKDLIDLYIPEIEGEFIYQVAKITNNLISDLQVNMYNVSDQCAENNKFIELKRDNAISKYEIENKVDTASANIRELLDKLNMG